jgi:peptidoglycan biosynthesis protein MviN/MurJ (putative lipid II flippase)
MINLAVGILWLCIGVIILGGVIWIALNVIRRFFPGMDANIDYAVWAIFGILILIYVLLAVAGGGGLPNPQLFR